jgi:hypothetical protein
MQLQQLLEELVHLELQLLVVLQNSEVVVVVELLLLEYQERVEVQYLEQGQVVPVAVEMVQL